MGTRDGLPLGSYGLFNQKEKPPGCQSSKKEDEKYDTAIPKLKGYNLKASKVKDLAQDKNCKVE